ncbi:hypothetical protein CERSUDRAFT_64575 [Gelatoporia subvermispora B]|uniref:Uncharacterized protein n=1 Tax=Ceriporiopsis subvermispora (strain B) TaxID=914234 RepID=M2QMP0_CERS8|nr:hypothetical protein CERSUDRAFT_64575 [Gelatoporia subvermispora B]
MPHKRAKRSIREQRRSQTTEINLASGSRSSITNEPIPKGAARILNATKIQKDWAEKKRKLQEDEDGRAGPAQKRRRKDTAEGDHTSRSTALKIQPGESIAHFNRRVEDSMRSSVRVAMKASSTIARKARKEEVLQKSGQPGNSKIAKGDPAARTKRKTSPETEGGGTLSTVAERKNATREDRPKEFQSLSTSTPKRLNDIAQAPPELKKLPRGATKDKAKQSGEAKTLQQGVLSMAQKLMLEEERERAVRLYREMKKQKMAAET